MGENLRERIIFGITLNTEFYHCIPNYAFRFIIITQHNTFVKNISWKFETNKIKKNIEIFNFLLIWLAEVYLILRLYVT